MIGTNLNLSLPALSDSLSTIVSKTAVALDAIQTSIADKATQAALSFSSSLDLNGNALTNVTSIQLAEGNYNQLPGAMFYALGEFFVTDSVATIQLTKNGVLNITAGGGFTGDYGAVGVGAAAEYNDAAGEFRFTVDPGDYADLVCDDLVLNGSTGIVRLGVDSAITTTRTINVKSLPSSGVSVLAYDAATLTLEDGATKTISGTQNFTNVKVSASGDYLHDTVRSTSLHIGLGIDDVGMAGYTHNKATIAGPVFTHRRAIYCVRVNDRVRTVTLRMLSKPAGTVNLEVWRYVAAGSDTETRVAGPASSTATGTVTLSLTVDTTFGSLSGAQEQWFVVVTGAFSSGVINGIEVTWDHPV